MKKLPQIFLFFIVPTIILFSQNDIKHLTEKLESANENEKVNLLLLIAEKYSDDSLSSSIKYANNALLLSKEINFIDGVISSYNMLGKISFKKKDFVEALKNYENAFNKITDSNKAKYYAEVVSSIAKIYLASGIYDKALENYLELLNFYRSAKDRNGEAFTLGYIGDIYSNIQSGKNALKYLKEALRIAEEINDDVRISTILNSLGGVYIEIIKDYKSAEEYYSRALSLSEKIDYKLGIAKAYHNLGLVYYYKKDLKTALSYHKQSLDFVIKSNINEGLAFNFNSIAEIYLEEGQVDSAIEYFYKALEVSSREKILILISENYKGLADSFKKKNNLAKALEYLELYNEIREKINNEKVNDRINELFIQYEIKSKESENEYLKRENAIQKKYLVFLLILGLIIILGFLHRYIYIKRLNKQLQELNATKDKLFSIIGHDLKNPFGTLINFSEILIEDYLELSDEEKITYLHMINEASQTGHEILDNLLQWSKTQSGKLEFVPQKILIQEIIDANISFLLSSAKKKGIELTSSSKDDKTEVFADKLMLKTIMRNLIGNAIKFSVKGGSIRISTKTNGKFIEIIVSDNGVGINSESKAKLFNPSVFHSTTGTSNEQGTGLGLLLCKEFVEKNGGKIWVESEVGKGSDFIFTVPLYQSA